jgi:hypothetical protein
VVVRDLDLIGVGVPPGEADTPLLVDADAVLTLPVAVQLLQPIG